MVVSRGPGLHAAPRGPSVQPSQVSLVAQTRQRGPAASRIRWVVICCPVPKQLGQRAVAGAGISPVPPGQEEGPGRLPEPSAPGSESVLDRASPGPATAADTGLLALGSRWPGATLNFTWRLEQIDLHWSEDTGGTPRERLA